MDEETIRHHFNCYKESGIKGLLKVNDKGTESKLSQQELVQLLKYKGMIICTKDRTPLVLFT